MLQQRDVVLVQLKLNLIKAQERMKKYADQKRVHKEFEIGDSVLVKLQPYRQHSAALRKNQKLGLRYFGPFPIMQRIGTVAYKHLLPPHAKIHLIFHVSQLKEFKGATDMVYVPLPLTTAVEGPILTPFRVLRKRQIMHGTTTIPQILVQWQGLGEHDITWEDTNDIVAGYPNFNLEDKVQFKGGSIVTIIDEEEGLEAGEKTKVSRHNQGHVAAPHGNDVEEKGKLVRQPNTRFRGYLLE